MVQKQDRSLDGTGKIISQTGVNRSLEQIIMAYSGGSKTKLTVSAPDRSIPGEILSNIVEYEREAYVNLRVGKYEVAEEFFRKLLNLIFEWQIKKDKPIHKGAPLHMIGMSLLYQDKTEDALRFFLLAYIEDTLNVGFELESEADLAPASLTLRNAFNIDVGFLKTIKENVATLKKEGKWAQARDPSKILDTLLNVVKPRSLLALCKSVPKVVPKQPVDPLPGTWQRRVRSIDRPTLHMAKNVVS